MHVYARQFGVGAPNEVVADQDEDIRIGHDCHVVVECQVVGELEAQLLDDAVVLVAALMYAGEPC